MKKIVAIGNALVDVLSIIKSDAVLDSLNLLKGGMQLIGAQKMQEIGNLTVDLEKKMVRGGSSANTISGLGNLGVDAKFIGKIGNDEVGDFFKNDIQSCNVKEQLLLSELYSGRCLVLISPDGERTMNTHLGAASGLHADEIVSEMFDGYDILHIEGYLVQNHQLIWKIAETAKKCGLKLSIDLASFNVVESNLSFLKELLTEFIDIVFANEEEAVALTGESAEKSVETIAAMCEIAVVKVGKRGSYVKSGDELFIIKTNPVNAVDTTGAGDLYASGFLFGLANGFNLQRCGEIGSLVANKIVQVVGTKMDNETWGEIKRAIYA
ncbi:MAG: adenosine kinase [Paludibacteraceae bacterium]|nr:adenosine kinase [Paludibacteraceae bacterium]